ALERFGVQCDAIEDASEPIEAMLGSLERDAPDHAVHLVPALQQELRQVGPVLPRDAGNESAFGHRTVSRANAIAPPLPSQARPAHFGWRRGGTSYTPAA